MVVDVLFVIILIISAGIAFIRGFIREVLTIAGVTLALLMAVWFGDDLVPLFDGWLGVAKDPEATKKLFDIIPYSIISKGLSYGSVFLVVMIVASIVTHFTAEGASKIGMGSLDRTLGVVFGLLRALLFMGLCYWPIYKYVDAETKESWFEKSKSHLYLQKTAEIIDRYIPDSFKQDADKAAETIEDTKANPPGVNLNINIESKNKEESGSADEGYQEPFRDEMNDLFRDVQVEDAPSGNTGNNQ